jgi:polar amino acid transport system substrate-binding protein
MVFSSGCSKNENIITSFEDAKTAKLGVMTGSTGEAVARKKFPQAQVNSFDDIMDAVAAIKSGQLDAIITLFPAALQVSKKNPELRLLPEALDKEDTAIAIKKGNDDLLAAVDRIISDLKSDGTLDSMKRRWLKADVSPYEELDIKLPKEGAVLKIGVSATREPFSFVDKDGRITGHDGELARLIGARLGRPIEFSNMKFMALIPALQSGKIDLIITGMTASAERKKTVNFTQPYFANTQVMIVRKAKDGKAASASPPTSSANDISALVRRSSGKNSANTPSSNEYKSETVKKVSSKLASVADLEGKRIGVMLGTVHDTYAMEHYPKATILQYKSPPDIVLAVKSGKIDIGIYTRETLTGIIRSDNELAILGDSLFSVPIGFGFNKNNSSLREKCNDFLRQIKENGAYNDMVDRWMKNGDTRMPEIVNTKTNGTIVVGNVSDKGMPFTIIKDNKLIGFDIELVERFGAYLGKEVKYADMEFGSLIAAAATNKIDMIASTLMITEERKKQISFSDVYYEIGTSLFALKKNSAMAGATTEATTTSPPFLQSIATSFRSNIIQENRYLLILDGLKTTIVISVLATIFGTLLGALVCFMRMSKKTLLNLPARVYISILRGTPVLVLLMLIFYVVFASVNISPILVAVIAFGMNFAAYSAEIFRSGIEGVDKGQSEAGISLGFTRVTTFLNIVLPQTVQRILPVYKGEFISLVKMTSIVGYIAVQDLTKASDIIRSRTFDAFFPLVMVAILYFLISWFLMQSLEYLERRTDPKYKRSKVRNP